MSPAAENGRGVAVTIFSSGPPLVFFDLDGTLIRGLSSESRFFAVLLRSRALGWRQMATFAGVGLKAVRRREKIPWKTNKAYLAGLTPAAVEALARPFVGKLAAAMQPLIKDRLDRHLARGDKVVLLTGAPDFIAQPLAEALGIRITAATVCACSGNCFTAALPTVHPHGETKRRIAARLCRAYGTRLVDSTAYANAISDLPLLNSVGRPIAVFPDRRLRRTAAARRWEIIG
ncbi:MAG TPA: HAD-IB family hydrolase, partial [Desulfosarcina sp.]|nr:HAD-IB family hydrolase [Desulfosarcina sp.]